MSDSHYENALDALRSDPVSKLAAHIPGTITIHMTRGNLKWYVGIETAGGCEYIGVAGEPLYALLEAVQAWAAAQEGNG